LEPFLAGSVFRLQLFSGFLALFGADDRILDINNAHAGPRSRRLRGRGSGKSAYRQYDYGSISHQRLKFQFGDSSDLGSHCSTALGGLRAHWKMDWEMRLFHGVRAGRHKAA
jgi:hypothetical protein